MAETRRSGKNWRREEGRTPGATRYELLVQKNPFRPGRRYKRWLLLVEHDNKPENIALLKQLTAGITSDTFFAECKTRDIFGLHVDTDVQSGSGPRTRRQLRVVAQSIEASKYFCTEDATTELRRVVREILERRGQPAFRARLIGAYGGTCAVTGCDAEPALEAAHIVPYCDSASNHISNGLHLRADVHTLFNLGLLKIHPDTLRIEIAEEISNSTYLKFHDAQLKVPRNSSWQPSKDALRERYSKDRLRAPDVALT